MAILKHIDKNVAEIFRGIKRKNQMKLIDYLDINTISFLDVSTREEALISLIDILEKNNKITNKDLFTKAIKKREQIVSTGIGMGVAIPHAKTALISDFFIALGIQKKKGINWQSLDQIPVRFIFLIGGPEDRQNEYLQILSHLTMSMKDLQLRKQLLQASSAKEVFELLKNY